MIPLLPFTEPVPDGESHRMAKRKNQSRSKYFWYQKYIGTLPQIDEDFQVALTRIAASTDLTLPDGRATTQEMLLSMLLVWIWELWQREGAKGVERELRQAREKVFEHIAADEKRQKGLPPPDGGFPEGLTRPKGKGPKGRGPNGKGPKKP